jgi:hypothetical protein
MTIGEGRSSGVLCFHLLSIYLFKLYRMSVAFFTRTIHTYPVCKLRRHRPGKGGQRIWTVRSDAQPNLVQTSYRREMRRRCLAASHVGVSGEERRR